MIKVKISEATPIILTFDGEVLECFFDEGGSKRFHVAHIKGIQLDANNKGKHLLTIKLKSDQVFLWVDEDALANVNLLLGPLQKAIASFKL